MAISRGVSSAARRAHAEPTPDRSPVLVVDERPWVAAAVVALLAEHGVAAERLAPAAVADGTVGEGVALVCVGDDDLDRVVRSLAGRGRRVVAYGCGNDTAAARAFDAGAAAVVHEASAETDLVATVRRAKTGIPLVDPVELDRLRGHLRRVRAGREPERLRSLTRREREILGALLDGRRAADIASADFVSVTTVRNQIQSILTKLNVNSQLEAVALARRLGWPHHDYPAGAPERLR
jgi:two-component system, NarL family, nitrate/nitrite response regulator NarL